MQELSNFQLMADYNQWMNRQVYDAAAKLSSRDLASDRGAFFGSVIGTLNHVLVGDVIWLKRFACHPENLNSLNYVRALDSPQSLDSILHSDLSALRKNREKIDAIILQFTDELTPLIVESSLSYRNMKNDPHEKKFGFLIQHFFNHQTHHRGQVTTLLSQLGVSVGVTDLLERIPPCSYSG